MQFSRYIASSNSFVPHGDFTVMLFQEEENWKKVQEGSADANVSRL